MALRGKSVKTLKNLGRLHNIISKSECSLWLTSDDNHKVSSWCLEISGLAAKIPSTSNSRTIAYCTRRVGHGQYKRTPFLRKSDSQNLRLLALTRLYFGAMIKQGNLRPNNLVFDEAEKVTVLVLLCKNKIRHDSHNYSKPVGDWLQSCNVIKDDTNAEILCFKKSEYPELFKKSATTTIIIIPRSLAKKATTGSDLFSVGGDIYAVKEEGDAERNLLWAVITQAILDCNNPQIYNGMKSNPNHKTNMIKEARRWLFDLESYHVGSARWVFQHLTEYPIEMQKKIIEWVETEGKQRLFAGPARVMRKNAQTKVVHAPK